MAYYHREGGGIVSKDDFAGESYTRQRWFTKPMATGKPEWLTPLENGEANIESLITFSLPIWGSHGKPSLVCYQPVPGTAYSLAIVCPDSDVLKLYNQLSTIIILILAAGLIVILIMCYRTVAQAIRPLNGLLAKTQDIASGNMEVHIPQTDRTDGRRG